MVILNKVCRSFGDVKVLQNVDVEIESKEHCVLLGSSGSGKSTLLYLIGGLDKATSGDVNVLGNNLSEMNDEELAKFRNQKIGFVFQFHFLLPSISCKDNILLPVKISQKKVEDYENLVEMLAKYLGVTHCLNKYPYQVSGGEQQRINIIRALILKPKLILCDEPTGNLDSVNSEKVVTLLRELADEFGSTLIVVTHDYQIAKSFQRKITIEDGQLIS